MVTDNIPTIHCIHTIYNMQKHWHKRNYVQNDINININIIYYTVYFR